MQKSIFYVCFIVCLVSGVIALSGCNTAKGAAVGVGATAMGVAEDAKGTWNGLVKADEWMKKNMW